MAKKGRSGTGNDRGTYLVWLPSKGEHHPDSARTKATARHIADDYCSGRVGGNPRGAVVQYIDFFSRETDPPKRVYKCSSRKGR